MDKYRIVAARPKDGRDLKAEFKTFKWVKKKDETWEWQLIGWLKTERIAALLQASAEVLTGKVENRKMKHGDAVELELRIVHNGSKYKLSEMPDE